MSDRPGRGRLLAWCALVGLLALLNYSSRAASGKPPKDFVFTWSASIGGLVQYAILFGLLLWIAVGLPLRQVFALRPPVSWRRAAGLCLAVFVAVYVLGAVLNPYLHPSREQGLTPSGWRPDRATEFVASVVVLAVIGPIVEELTFRGLGFAVLERLGRPVAIVLVGIAFGVAHGLVEALPLLVFFGAGLAWIRSRTASIYPGMLLHSVFNAIALIGSVWKP